MTGTARRGAVELFHGPERLNCAQAILCVGGADDERIRQARAEGSGRAEGGRCGALHALLCLVDDPAVRHDLTGRFVAEAGDERCREIRRLKSLSCRECVALAERLLQEKTGDS